MNDIRRRAIAACIDSLSHGSFEGVMGELEDILFDEQDALDNTPENLCGSYRYSESEDAICHLDAAIGYLQDSEGPYPVDEIVSELLDIDGVSRFVAKDKTLSSDKNT